jgi:hypothetical protein
MILSRSVVMCLLISIVLLLITVLIETGYSQELVGKTFWCTRSTPVFYHLCDDEKTLDAPRKIGNLLDYGTRYELEVNGEKNWAFKYDVDRAIEQGVLVPYDREEQRQRAAKAAAQAKAAQAKRTHDRLAQIKAKNWPSEIEQAVIERKVRMGMTAEQVTLAWGKPQQLTVALICTLRTACSRAGRRAIGHKKICPCAHRHIAAGLNCRRETQTHHRMA